VQIKPHVFLAFLFAVALQGPIASAEEPALGRPGLAIHFDVEGDAAKVIIALNYLLEPDAVPKLVGVRRYTYDVRVNAGPERVGFKGREAAATALLGGAKFLYTVANMDRQENGSLSVTKLDDADGRYRLRGVYHYSGQLFIIDTDAKAGETITLYELPPEKK
jgi:hypothetical protein